jgi:hypothetical protein
MTGGIEAPKKVARERIIEDAVMSHPELLGYPNAIAMRNWVVSPNSGRLDIGLFPESGPVQLVLVEAKAAVAPDAASKVVGQLMMYYTGALALGTAGLTMLRDFASTNVAEARSSSKKSHVRLAGVKPTGKAWAALTRGSPLTPEQLAMYIALDNDPHRAVEPVLSMLRERHGLPIGLVVVVDGIIRKVSPPPAA